MSALARMLATLKRDAHAFASDESGATAVEYGLLVALIFMVITAAVNEVGQKAIALIASYLST